MIIKRVEDIDGCCQRSKWCDEVSEETQVILIGSLA